MTSIIYMNSKATCTTLKGKPPCTLRKFYDMLKDHDWYYSFSDDFGVWQRGNAQQAELTAMSKLSPEHKKLYAKFHGHYFCAEAGFGDKKRTAIPKRP